MIDSTQLTNRVLNLDDPASSDRMIRVDGTQYPLLGVNELPPLDVRRFLQLSHQLDDLVGKDALTADEETALEALPRQLVGLIVRAPAEVLDRLDSVQRSRIINAFLHAREGA